MSRKDRALRPGGKASIHAILGIGALLMIVPFIWMVLTSFYELGRVSECPVLIPARLRWRITLRFLDLPFLGSWNTTITTIARYWGNWSLLYGMAMPSQLSFLDESVVHHHIDMLWYLSTYGAVSSLCYS